MDSKVVAIIPARGGSKRIPRKNIKLFHNKPIIAYSIEAAIKSKLFHKIIVTTDDEEIAKIAREYGAEVPYLRPKELADDITAPQAAIDHMLDYLDNNCKEKYEIYCTLYPTSPMLQVKYLKEGFEKLSVSDAVNVFSVTETEYPIQRSFKLNKNNRCEMFWPEYYPMRSQDIEKAYHDAAQFYWTHRDRKDPLEKTFLYSEDSLAVILPRFLVQDIDYPEDWEYAELMYELLLYKGII